MIRVIGVMLVCAVSLVACGGTSGSPPPLPPPVHDGDAPLGPGDAFEVRVYGEEELSGKYQVSGDGTIDFPLLGRLEVAGKQSTAVADELKRQLRERDILKNPQVSILITDNTSNRISVVGAVAQPGTFPLTSGLTVVQAISLANGFTPLASRNDIIVTRRVGGQLRRYRIEVEKVTEGRAEDFALRAGDIIYVPERLF